MSRGNHWLFGGLLDVVRCRVACLVICRCLWGAELDSLFALDAGVEAPGHGDHGLGVFGAFSVRFASAAHVVCVSECFDCETARPIWGDIFVCQCDSVRGRVRALVVRVVGFRG